MPVTWAGPRQLARHPGRLARHPGQPPAADEREGRMPGPGQRPAAVRRQQPECTGRGPSGGTGAGRQASTGKASTAKASTAKARTAKARTRIRPRPEPWAVRALIKAATIEHRLRITQLTHGNDPACRITSQAVLGLITMARQACHERHGLLDHWCGTSAERAYRSLHEAEALLVDLVSLDQVEADVSKVVARAMTALEPGDPRRAEAQELPRMPRGPVKRLRLKNVMAASYAAADEAHVRLRDFRNLLCVTAVLIAILMGLFTFLVSANPSMVPFCFTPSPHHRVCPAGGLQPSGGDVIIVAGLGLLGGVLAAAFAVRNIRGTSTPYDIPIALAVLKAPTGALTAVAGLMLLRGNFLPGLSALDSQQQILAYAFVLGYAQQVFTHFVDRQAQSILDSVPGKGTRTTQQAPAPGPPAPASGPVAPAPGPVAPAPGPVAPAMPGGPGAGAAGDQPH
jgi:hypothetical protein